MKKNGFTLIELMLVVAIIGLLAAIAIPKFANMVVKAREASMKGQLGAIRSALSIYYSDNEGVYPSDIVVGGTCSSINENASVLDGKYINKIPVIRHATQSDTGHNGNCVISWPNAVDAYYPMVYVVAFVGGPPLGQVIISCDHTDTKSKTWSQW
ncbi:MAG TPA: type II secretion system protein [Elusimicrobiota bacterium]|jgi:prepilin-type N-terminal cleavage/methylation domain-containing protein|nr:type II secretion system protein [Elusimicrobiota bacterium]